jgi:hypothetical protein
MANNIMLLFGESLDTNPAAAAIPSRGRARKNVVERFLSTRRKLRRVIKLFKICDAIKLYEKLQRECGREKKFMTSFLSTTFFPLLKVEQKVARSIYKLMLEVLGFSP